MLKAPATLSAVREEYPWAAATFSRFFAGADLPYAGAAKSISMPGGAEVSVCPDILISHNSSDQDNSLILSPVNF